MSQRLDDEALKRGKGLQVPSGFQARFCSIVPKKENFMKTPRWESCRLHWPLGPPGQEVYPSWLISSSSLSQPLLYPDPELLPLSLRDTPHCGRCIQAGTQHPGNEPFPPQMDKLQGKLIPARRKAFVCRRSPWSQGTEGKSAALSMDPLS